MIFRDQVILTQKGVYINNKALETIGIFPNNSVHILPFRTFEYRDEEDSKEMNLDLFITSIPAEKWPFVARFVLRLRNRTGSLSKALEFFKNHNINVLHVDSTHSGHHHSVLNIFGELKRIEAMSLKHIFSELISARERMYLDSGPATIYDNIYEELHDEAQDIIKFYHEQRYSFLKGIFKNSFKGWFPHREPLTYFAYDNYINYYGTNEEMDDKKLTEKKLYEIWDFDEILNESTSDEIKNFEELYLEKDRVTDRNIIRHVGNYLAYHYYKPDEGDCPALIDVLEMEIKKARPIIEGLQNKHKSKKGNIVTLEDLYKRVEFQILPIKVILQAIIMFKRILVERYELLILQFSLQDDEIEKLLVEEIERKKPDFLDILNSKLDSNTDDEEQKEIIKTIERVEKINEDIKEMNRLIVEYSFMRKEIENKKSLLYNEKRMNYDKIKRIDKEIQKIKETTDFDTLLKEIEEINKRIENDRIVNKKKEKEIEEKKIKLTQLQKEKSGKTKSSKDYKNIDEKINILVKEIEHLNLDRTELNCSEISFKDDRKHREIAKAKIEKKITKLNNQKKLLLERINDIKTEGNNHNAKLNKVKEKEEEKMKYEKYIIGKKKEIKLLQSMYSEEIEKQGGNEKNDTKRKKLDYYPQSVFLYNVRYYDMLAKYPYMLNKDNNLLISHKFELGNKHILSDIIRRLDKLPADRKRFGKIETRLDLDPVIITTVESLCHASYHRAFEDVSQGIVKESMIEIPPEIDIKKDFMKILTNDKKKYATIAIGSRNTDSNTIRLTPLPVNRLNEFRDVEFDYQRKCNDQCFDQGLIQKFRKSPKKNIDAIWLPDENSILCKSDNHSCNGTTIGISKLFAENISTLNCKDDIHSEKLNIWSIFSKIDLLSKNSENGSIRALIGAPRITYGSDYGIELSEKIDCDIKDFFPDHHVDVKDVRVNEITGGKIFVSLPFSHKRKKEWLKTIKKIGVNEGFREINTVENYIDPVSDAIVKYLKESDAMIQILTIPEVDYDNPNADNSASLIWLQAEYLAAKTIGLPVIRLVDRSTIDDKTIKIHKDNATINFSARDPYKLFEKNVSKAYEQLRKHLADTLGFGS
jgi:hypothetical protein